MRALRCALALPIALTAWLAAGCAGKGVEKEAVASTEPKPVIVTAAPARRQVVERTVEAVGTLKGWEDVTIGSKKEGRVLRVLHDMGDKVKPGEPLVELEPDDARYAVMQARSRCLSELAKLGMTWEQAEESLKKHGVTEELIRGEEATELIKQTPAIAQMEAAVQKARNNYNRQKSLHARGAGTMEELQNTETDLKSAEAARDNAIATARNIIAMAVVNKVAFDNAEQSLRDLTVRVPTPTLMPAGVTGPLVYAVAKRMVGEGQMLKPGDAVMQLVIEAPLRLWISVPENHASEVRLGQPVKLRVASFPDTTFDGTVARINPTVDAASRTFQVEAVIANNRGLLRPGGFAKASIITERTAEATVVPIEAVVQYAGVTKLFVIDGDRVRSFNIETGLEGNGWVEVIGKLPPDAKVVLTGQSQLADGTPVILRKDEEETTAKAEESKTKPQG